MNQSNCNNCMHFYITYKKYYPYGCKAFGIISKNNPYLEIKKVSGTYCALFQKKKKSVKTFNKGRFA